MSLHFILLDFENVQPTSIGSLQPGTCRIKVFLGQHQCKVPLELTRALQPFGADVQYTQIAGNGPNALDFHIAFYIGRLAMLHTGARFTILSRDAGFDPLIKHLAALNIACRRVTCLGDADTAVASKPVITAPRTTRKLTFSFAPTPDGQTSPAPTTSTKAGPLRTAAAITAESLRAKADAALARLIGMKAARPASLKTLRSSIAAWSTPRLNGKTCEAVLQQLVHTGKVKLTGNKVGYALKKTAQR